MLLIGSRAIQYWLPDWREPLDVDLVGTYEEIEAYRKRNNIKVFYPINQGKTIFMRDSDGVIHEAEIAWEGSRAEKLIKFVTEHDVYARVGQGIIVPSLDVLLLLKESHKYLKDSSHTVKTYKDIQALKAAGAIVRPEHMEFLKDREKDTYVNKLPKLNQSKDGFFGADTGVLYEYDHDTIHEAVKHLERPAYTYFQTGEVWCSRELWDKCSEEIKLYAAYEEISVLAIERCLVPFAGKKTPKEAFDMAQVKLMTSISSGWFREYVWNAYDRLQAMYTDEYFEKFKRGLEQGIVKPHDYKEAA